MKLLTFSLIFQTFLLLSYEANFVFSQNGKCDCAEIGKLQNKLQKNSKKLQKELNDLRNIVFNFKKPLTFVVCKGFKDLKCQPGKKIKIYTAVYIGRSDPTTCDGSRVPNNNYFVSATNYANFRCKGKNYCRLLADNIYVGNPK